MKRIDCEDVGGQRRIFEISAKAGLSETAGCSAAFSEREMEIMRRAFSAGVERANQRECFKFLGWFDREKDLLARIGR